MDSAETADFVVGIAIALQKRASTIRATTGLLLNNQWPHDV
jgi:hypothetical protein